MYNLYVSRASYPFVGEVLKNDRYNADLTPNPLWKVGGLRFQFGIITEIAENLNQPSAGFVLRSKTMTIETKEKSDLFKKDNFIVYNGITWIIKTINEDIGPIKTIYNFVTINPNSKYIMVLESVQE